MLSNTDQKNAVFWNEPCGSNAAKTLGLTDASPKSLKRYDDWYLNFYPYLPCHVPTHLMRGRSVLEVGLGYGTLSQQIVQSGAQYTGLDIAQGPVDLVNHRIKQTPGATGEAIQGSILEPRLEEETFDYVVAIGALHHTGDLAGAISRCRELLRPGGELRFMVYNAYSYRRFMQARHATSSIGNQSVVDTAESSEATRPSNIRHQQRRGRGASYGLDIRHLIACNVRGFL